MVNYYGRSLFYIMNEIKILPQKRIPVFQFLFSFLLISALFISCKPKQEENVVINPPQQFENNTWTFKKIDKGNDVELDKTLTFEAQIDDIESFYDVSIAFEYFSDIPVQSLPLVLTTQTADGRSSQSINVLLEFDDKESVKELSSENGKKVMQYTKIIYPQKKFPQSGKYNFIVYSKYDKISLPGVKSLTIKAVKNNSK